MTTAADDQHDPPSQNSVDGKVWGPVVQAHSIDGDVHLKEYRTVNHIIYVEARPRSRDLTSSALYGGKGGRVVALPTYKNFL